MLQSIDYNFSSVVGVQQLHASLEFLAACNRAKDRRLAEVWLKLPLIAGGGGGGAASLTESTSNSFTAQNKQTAALNASTSSLAALHQPAFVHLREIEQHLVASQNMRIEQRLEAHKNK
jgi:hypothetical protein